MLLNTTGPGPLSTAWHGMPHLRVDGVGLALGGLELLAQLRDLGGGTCEGPGAWRGVAWRRAGRAEAGKRRCRAGEGARNGRGVARETGWEGGGGGETSWGTEHWGGSRRAGPALFPCVLGRARGVRWCLRVRAARGRAVFATHACIPRPPRLRSGRGGRSRSCTSSPPPRPRTPADGLVVVVGGGDTRARGEKATGTSVSHARVGQVLSPACMQAAQVWAPCLPPCPRPGHNTQQTRVQRSQSGLGAVRQQPTCGPALQCRGGEGSSTPPTHPAPPTHPPTHLEQLSKVLAARLELRLKVLVLSVGLQGGVADSGGAGTRTRNSRSERSPARARGVWGGHTA